MCIRDREASDEDRMVTQAEYGAEIEAETTEKDPSELQYITPIDYAKRIACLLYTSVTTVTKSVLYVNVTLKSYRDMISVYGFNSDQEMCIRDRTYICRDNDAACH